MAENQSLVQRVAIGAVACAAGALIGHLVTRTDQRTCSKAPYHSPASQALPPSASPPHAQHQSSSPRFAPGIRPLATAESPYLLDGETLTPEALVYLGYNMDAVIDLSPKAWFNVREGRAVVDNVLRRKEVVYGINTGFGNFANVIISDDNLAALQLNLIRSHAAGVGEPLSVQQTRMLLILRINVLAKGFSGIREETVRNMLAALNANCLSKVPAQGSVGASGDLAPLSHLALGLIGEGEMWDLRGGCEPDGSFMPRFLPAAEVLKAANVSHITLQAKEGLALINGTQLIASLGAEAVVRARLIAHQADCISALTLEALKGSATAFHPRIHNTRPHRGQLAVASRLRALLNFGGTASQISSSHYNCGKVQDSYTLRCIPQIHGICHDSVDFVYDILVTELNSATDNPMIFSHERRRAVTASPAVDIFRQYDSVGIAYKLGQHQPAKAAEAPLNAGALDPAAWANMSKDELVSVLKSVAAAVTPALGSASATDASLASDEAKHSGLRHSTSTDLLATMAGRVAEYAKGHHLKLTHGIATSPRSLQPDDDEGNDEGDKEANDPHHSHGGFGSVSLISDDDGQGDVNEGVILSGGNFHGEYPAKALDFLAIGVHELASVSERRIERLVNPALSGLPAFLVKEGGLNSGFMIAHCTAAALVSENKVLCHPSSVDSLSTSAAQEDHVSMGGWSARKALKVVAHVEQCLAIELLAACQAIEFLRPLKSTKPLEAMLALVRQHVPNWAADRHMSPDIDIVTRLLREGKVWQACAPFVSARH